ncbi:hypothetical protein ADUPG1_012039, partial [Aduncisulcus paluster]
MGTTTSIPNLEQIKSIFICESSSNEPPISRFDSSIITPNYDYIVVKIGEFLKLHPRYSPKSAALSMLLGEGFLCFSYLFIPFHAASSIKKIAICVNSQFGPISLSFLFTLASGDKIARIFHFSTNPLHLFDDISKWFYLPVGLSDVLTVEIEGKGMERSRNANFTRIDSILFIREVSPQIDSLPLSDIHPTSFPPSSDVPPSSISIPSSSSSSSSSSSTLASPTSLTSHAASPLTHSLGTQGGAIKQDPGMDIVQAPKKDPLEPQVGELMHRADPNTLTRASDITPLC